MIENQTLQAFPIFGDNASKVQPEAAVYTNGYAPNDVLPAEHFNWFMGNASNAITILNQGISSIEAELNTLIACAGMTSDVSCTSQVYNAVMYQINNCISKYAIKNHASNTNTYGLGNAANYGHVQLSDSINSSCGVGNGVAATPLAVKTVSDKLNALYGDNLPKQLGTAAVGTSNKFAREDHVHPTTGLATLAKVGDLQYYGITLPSDSPNWIRTPICGILPYINDCVNGASCLGDPFFPFKKVYAKCFHGKAECASLIETSAYVSTNAYRRLMIAESSCFGNDKLKGDDSLEVWIDNCATYLSVGCRRIGNPGILYLWNGCTGYASIETSHKTGTIVGFCLPEVGGTLATTSSTVACATNATNAACASNAFYSYKSQYAEKLNFYSDNTNIDKKIVCCGAGSCIMYHLFVVNCTSNNLLGVFTGCGPEKNIKILSAGEGVDLYSCSICSCVVAAKNSTCYINLG